MPGAKSPEGSSSHYSSLPPALDDLDSDHQERLPLDGVSSTHTSSSASSSSTLSAAWDDDDEEDALPHLHRSGRPVIHYSLQGGALSAFSSDDSERPRGPPRSAEVEAILRAGEPEEEAMSGDTFFDDHDDDIERLLSVNTHSSNSTGNSTSSRSGGGIGISKGMDAFPPGTKTSMTPMSVSIDDYDYSYASSRAYSSSSGTFDKTWREKTRSRLARAVRAAVEAESGSWMAYAVGWTAMLLAILSSAATTPMFKYLEESGVSPGLAACWRSQAMSVFLVPIAVVEALTTGQHIKAWERRPDLEYQIFVHVGFAGLGWAASLLFYINGLELTTAVRASLITNMHPLIMVLYMCLRGQRVDRLDWGGVLLAFSGIMVMALDKVGSSGVNHRDVHASSSPMLELCGMFLCLAAATADCFVMINRKMIKKYVPLMQYTCVTALFVLVACAIFSMLFEDTEVFCVGRNDCLFGWAGSRWIQPMATFGFVNGVVCQAGFNFAMQYIDPLLFSSLLLLGVPITGVLAWLAGVQSIPDMATWLGGAIILAGIVVVTYSEHAKSQEIAAYGGHDAVSTDSNHSDPGGSYLGSSSRGGDSSSSHGGKTPPRYASDESRFEFHLPELDADVGHEDFGFLLDDTSSAASSPPYSSAFSNTRGRAGGAEAAGNQRPRQTRVVGLESALAL